ncbi:MAG: short-chain dehydrogenase [Gammaproteobacteria bacterium]|nr:short-chain dehydrogenase [Gammaproteobacteria bacterium]
MKGLDLNLKGEKALITGGSHGLGSFISQAFGKAGADLAIHYNTNETSAKELAKSLEGSVKVETFRADLSDPDNVRTLMRNVIDSLGGVSILVNCAASETQNTCALGDLTDEKWEFTQRVNLQAPMILTQEFAKQKKDGSVINILSIEGQQPAPGHAHYSISKSALEMLTKASALEFGYLGIRVNGIAPGLIYREGIDSAWPEGVELWKKNAPLEKLVDPEDIANAAIFLASDKASSISGSVLTIDCGVSATPRW